MFSKKRAKRGGQLVEKALPRAIIMALQSPNKIAEGRMAYPRKARGIEVMMLSMLRITPMPMISVPVICWSWLGSIHSLSLCWRDKTNMYPAKIKYSKTLKKWETPGFMNAWSNVAICMLIKEMKKGNKLINKRFVADSLIRFIPIINPHPNPSILDARLVSNMVSIWHHLTVLYEDDKECVSTMAYLKCKPDPPQ